MRIFIRTRSKLPSEISTEMETVKLHLMNSKASSEKTHPKQKNFGTRLKVSMMRIMMVGSTSMNSNKCFKLWRKRKKRTKMQAVRKRLSKEKSMVLHSKKQAEKTLSRQLSKQLLSSESKNRTLKVSSKITEGNQVELSRDKFSKQKVSRLEACLLFT